MRMPILTSFPPPYRPPEAALWMCGRPLAAHKDEYIYYRTDHHWTSLGAYYAYQQLCGTLSLTPFDPPRTRL